MSQLFSRVVLIVAISLLIPNAPALGVESSSPLFTDYIREFPAPYQGSFHGIAAFRGVLYTVSGLHVYRSADGGRNWAACATTGMKLPDLNLTTVAASGSRLWMLAGNPGSGALLYSDDGGLSWRNSIPNTPEAAPHGLLSRGDTLIAYGGDLTNPMGAICYKVPQGDAWLAWGNPTGGYPVSVTSFGPYIYAEFEKGYTRTILRARGPGTAWEMAETGLPISLGPDNSREIPELWFGQRNGQLYAAMDQTGVYALGPDGRTWTKGSRGYMLGYPFFFQTRSGLGMIAWDSVFVRDDATGAWRNQGVVPGERWDNEVFAVLGDSIVAVNDKRAYVSVDGGASWRPMETQSLLRESGDKGLVAALEWGGGFFLHYMDGTFRTGNGGRDWEAMDSIVREDGVTMHAFDHPLVFLIATRGKIILFYRGPNQFARYEPNSGVWKMERFPLDSTFTFSIGADPASLVRHVQSYAHGVGIGTRYQLQRSVDEGVTWRTIPAPDSVLSISNDFEKIQVDGNGVLVFGEPFKQAAASLDGGLTWIKPPDSAAVLLDAGCLHWVDKGESHSKCAGSTRFVSAPFRRARKLWGDGRGTLFAWADSALYVSPADARTPIWKVLATKAELRGWAMEGDVLSMHADEKVRIFSPGSSAATAIANHPESGRRDHLRPSPRFTGRMIWFDFAGLPHDIRGKRSTL